MDLEFADNPQEERYEVRGDGAVLGIAAYRLRPGLIAFIHTHVDPRLEGHGAGSKLARFALDDARRRELAVLPFCPFIFERVRRPAWSGAPPRARKFGIDHLVGLVGGHRT